MWRLGDPKRPSGIVELPSYTYLHPETVDGSRAIYLRRYSPLILSLGVTSWDASIFQWSRSAV
jgi:hypothetical protein